jgi:hypothetical protein
MCNALCSMENRMAEPDKRVKMMRFAAPKPGFALIGPRPSRSRPAEAEPYNSIGRTWPRNRLRSLPANGETPIKRAGTELPPGHNWPQ